MHKSLTESLHLAGTVVSVSHHGKIRVHAGIPAAVTVNTVPCVVILNVIALTGRTYEGTGSAGKTRLVQFLPYRRIETVHVFFLRPSFQ